MISYLDYKTQYLGKSNVGNTPEDMGECDGLFQLFLQLNGISFIFGDAKDIYINAPSNIFDKLLPDTQVQQGDVFVCDRPWGWDAQAKVYRGHIGFVDQPMQGQSFMGFEANGTYNPPHKVQLVFHQNRLGFKGILRFKEGIMEPEFNSGDRVNINLWLYGKDLGLHQNAIGKPYKAAIDFIFHSPDFIHEHNLNGGDATNVDTWLNRTDAASQVGKVWKDVAYNYIKPNIPQA